MKIIAEFERIRDIPYRIPLSTQEIDQCCSWKAKMLKAILESQWYEVKYRICSFRRSDMNLPDNVSSVEHEDLSSHVYLEVLINKKWINVDPTRDIKIKNVLPVETWNWKESTGIAVKPLELFDHETSRKIMEDESKEGIEDDLVVNWKFYEAFNNWLEMNRF